MSPRRRHTQGSDAQAVESKTSPSKRFDAVSRKRLVNESKSSPQSSAKAAKSTRESPLRRKTVIVENASSPRRNVSSPRRNVSAPSTPKRTLRTPQKALDKSPKKSPKISTNVKASPQKSTKKSHLVEVVTKMKPQSPSKTAALQGKNLKTSPKKTTARLSHSTVCGISPIQQRNTRGSPSCKAPSSAVPTASPTKSPKKAVKSSPKKSISDSPKPQSPSVSTRKRTLSSPAESPQSPKTRRLKGKVLIPAQLNIKSEPEEDVIVLDGVDKDCFSDIKHKSAETTGLPSGLKVLNYNPKKAEKDLPELTGRFLRRKWFSLKSRGGYSSLRSAILSPEEIAQEVLQKTMVATPKDNDVNFFTTKLMVRLQSKLPPVRSRPSCEELLQVSNTSHCENKDSSKDSKVEGTAIRVKLEKRSFTDTVSQVTSKPAPTLRRAPASPSKSEGKMGLFVPMYVSGNLTRKQEREIAIRQLKNLKNL